MQKAALQTQSSQKEAAELIAQRDAAQRKVRLEQETRDAKEREARKAQLLRELDAKKKAEEEAIRKEQRERDRAQVNAERQQESHSWASALYTGKGKSNSGPSSATNKPVKQLQERSDKSRVSSRLHSSSSPSRLISLPPSPHLLVRVMRSTDRPLHERRSVLSTIRYFGSKLPVADHDRRGAAQAAVVDLHL